VGRARASPGPPRFEHHPGAGSGARTGSSGAQIWADPADRCARTPYAGTRLRPLVAAGWLGPARAGGGADKVPRSSLGPGAGLQGRPRRSEFSRRTSSSLRVAETGNAVSGFETTMAREGRGDTTSFRTSASRQILVRHTHPRADHAGSPADSEEATEKFGCDQAAGRPRSGAVQGRLEASLNNRVRSDEAEAQDAATTAIRPVAASVPTRSSEYGNESSTEARAEGSLPLHSDQALLGFMGGAAELHQAASSAIRSWTAVYGVT